jgi:hypothetical protein
MRKDGGRKKNVWTKLEEEERKREEDEEKKTGR